jgi:integrase
MNCKYCKREIEPDSVFCRWCGERVQRAKRKPKEEVRVPPPSVTPSGKYRGRVMVRGSRVWITEDTEAAYYVRAKAVKAGMIQEAANTPKDTLRQLIDRFVSDNEAVLSPSTVPAYRSYSRNAFQPYMDMRAGTIPWQRAVSDEAGRVSAKTLENEWRLVTAALRYAKVPVPTVNLPRTVRHERLFLDFEQIQAFVGAIRGDPCELAYLLALHSLRLSEILAIREIADTIRVRGAMVRGENGYTVNELNKTDLSRRDVPVMIPRVRELPLPVVQRDTTLNRHLAAICAGAGLPVVTLHGLRHSFASLAYHLRWTEKTTMRLGGWSTPDVVHDIYTHLAQQDVDDDVERMRAFYDAVSKSVSKNDS